MTTKSLPHICYSYHTDSGDGQSMRTKGAARSHKILLDFLYAVGTNIGMDDELSLNLSIMEDTRTSVVRAKEVRRLLLVDMENLFLTPKSFLTIYSNGDI